MPSPDLILNHRSTCNMEYTVRAIWNIQYVQYGIYNNSTFTLENPNCWISSSNQYIMKTKSGPVKNDKVTVN